MTNFYKVFAIFLSILLISSFACTDTKSEIKKETTQTNPIPTPLPKKEYRIKIIRTFQHDKEAFTQGLIYFKGFLYESTGLNGKSSLRKLDVKTGKVIKKINVGEKYFSEGIAIHDNKIYMLTWLNRTCFVYDLETFKLINEFSYYGEGWGLTTFDDKLLMSDGKNIIRVINPTNFSLDKAINILDENSPVQFINELELVDNILYANIWQSDKIAMIDINTGLVISYLDMTSLREMLPSTEGIDVLNGIAYNNDSKTFYATGKNWPLLFEFVIE
ncbi:MAG: glutaminyl-peptide cyclotransferase [Candidatus Kapabacteria bacterium]|nr:glutaminyl-peptide cyclotransferase [Candidatus Kapabacteria bacterium]